MFRLCGMFWGLVESRLHCTSGRSGDGRRWVCLLIAVPLLVFLVAGCGQRETRVEVGDREQILFKGNGGEPQELDPYVVTGVSEYHIIMSLLEGLVTK